MNPGNFKASILSGFAWQSLTKLFVQVFSWVSTIIVARILAPSDYGLMATVGIFTGLLTLLFEMGLSQGLIQKKDISREEEDGIFCIGIFFGFAAYLILYFTAPYVAGFYANNDLSGLLRLSAVALILGSLKAVPFSIAMRQMNFRYRSLVEMFANFASMITVLILAYRGSGVWSLVWGYLAMNVVSTICYLPLFKRWPGFTLPLKECYAILAFGIKVTANNLLYFIYSKADVFIIGRMLGEKMLGYYSMAFQLATMPLDKIGTIFNQVAFPAIARIQHDREQAKVLFLNLHRYLLIVTYPLLLGFALVAEELVLLLLTAKWLPIVPILQAFCVLNLLRISGMLISPVLYGRGKAGKVLVYAALSSILLPLSFWVGAAYGMQGVLIAWMIVYPILYAVLLIYCLHDLKIRFMEYLDSGVAVIIASGVMVCAVLLLKMVLMDEAVLWRLLAVMMSGAISYSLVFVLFYKAQIREIREGIAILRKQKASAAS